MARTEATLMREALEHEYGVPVRWIGGAVAHDARERALHGADPARRRASTASCSSRIRVDMRRATAEFAQHGIATIPAPTGIPARDFGGPMDLLPSMSGLQGSYYAIYELVALVVLWITPTP